MSEPNDPLDPDTLNETRAATDPRQSADLFHEPGAAPVANPREGFYPGPEEG